jgi:hypothetical protein
VIAAATEPDADTSPDETPADSGVIEVPDDLIGGERHEEWATA